MNQTQRIKIVLGIALLGIYSIGCAATSTSVKSSAEMEKEKAIVIPASPAVAEGSLWSARNPVFLYADVKARNVGDIVTINIVESASASKNATTKTERSSGFDASWTGVLKKLSGDWVGGEVSADFKNDFDGKGETTRNSRLNAYISVQVVQVLPNGNLVIAGSRQVQVNNETQIINIQGIIRPEDVSSNNVILSTFISDAKIELNGQGIVSDKQRPGWFARVLDWVWPF